jgi:tetratricopeptide (TPR) repeat protein
MTTLQLLLASWGSIILMYIILKNRKRIIVQAKKDFLKKTLDKKSKKPRRKSLVYKESTKPSLNHNVIKYTQQDIAKGIAKAEILIEHHEDQEAEKILISIISVEKKHINAHILLAALYLRKKQFSRAEVLYKNLMQLQNTKDPKTLSNLAFCLFELNHLEDSLLLYEESLSLDNQNPKRYTNIAQVLYILKRYDKALFYLKKAQKIKPRDTFILFMLADTYKEAGRKKLAKEVYKNILDYEPYNSSAREEVSKLL